MDCTEFDATVIDGLYDELDGATRAAADRHAAGCRPCARLRHGLALARRAGASTLRAPPSGLVPRVLAAADAAGLARRRF